MYFKEREKSQKLLTLESLDTRMILPEPFKQHYLALKKGFEGELQFDSMLRRLECECIILNDLLLKVGQTLFQIDTFVIFSSHVHIFDVKNYEGDYLFKDQKIVSKKSNIEIVNPLNQLNRSESLMKQTLTSFGYSLPIESSIVFVNPEFTLYHAPENEHFIYPTQLKRLIRNLNNTPSKIGSKHIRLAEKLVSLHNDESPYNHLPSYQFEDLRKGMYCGICKGFEIKIEGRRCICNKCSHVEFTKDAILRNIKEFIMLFPEDKITMNTIYEWCGGVVSKAKIRKVLKDHFNIIGVHQWAFYVEKKS